MTVGSPREPRLLAGVSWVLAANLVYLGVSAALTLVLPRFITPVEFGWWQLYQLFALYLGYVTFGYTDGINLRVAGKRFPELSRREFSSGLVYLLVLDVLAFAGLIGLVSTLSGSMETHIFILAVMGAVSYVPRTLVSMVFQSTGRVRALMLSMTIERLALALAMGSLLLLGHREATFLVIADVLSKFVGLLVSLAFARPMFGDLFAMSRATWNLFWADCRAGLFVLGANVSAMLINGAVRLGVVLRWDVATFGKVSLAFQFAGMFMVAINAVSASLLPNLRRLPVVDYGKSYLRLRQRLVTPLVLALALAFPMRNALDWWLPEYGDAGLYAALLFPLSMYESINRGLTSAFLKAMRLERRLLGINLVALVTALVIAGLGILVGSLPLTVISIVIALGVRALLGELVVARALGLRIALPWVGESLIVSAFLACIFGGSPTWCVGAVLIMLTIYGALAARASSSRLGPAPRIEQELEK